MPPPKASTEGPRDRHVHHEMGQIVRALEANGPQQPEDLAGSSVRSTGSRAASTGALALAVSDGLVTRRAADGSLRRRLSRPRRDQVTRRRRPPRLEPVGLRPALPAGDQLVHRRAVHAARGRCRRARRAGPAPRSGGTTPSATDHASMSVGFHGAGGRHRTSRCDAVSWRSCPASAACRANHQPRADLGRRGRPSAEASLRFSSGMCDSASSSLDPRARAAGGGGCRAGSRSTASGTRPAAGRVGDSRSVDLDGPGRASGSPSGRVRVSVEVAEQGRSRRRGG